MAGFIVGGIMGVLSLFGLFLASRAHDGMFYMFGLLLCLFGIVFIFALIHKATAAPKAE